MGKKASLTPIQRGQIIALHQEGLSERDISVKMKCSKTAVHNSIVKFKDSGSYSDKKRKGRPRKTSARDDHVIRRIAVKSPTSSSKKIRSVLLNKGTNVSSRTVRRRLEEEFHLKSRKPAFKPRLTSLMKMKRLSFARKHANWTKEQWGKVLFSDESTILQFGSRKHHVRRPIGKRYDERYVQQTMKHPPSIMIWGSMSAQGTAGLYFLKPGTTMNGQKYLALLEEKLDIHMTIKDCEIFMHDGAPCHRSKIVSEFLKKNKISVLEWPGNSPDLNPIENLWTLLKDKVADRYPTSLSSLEECIKIVWAKEINQEYCKTLVESMPRRLEAVIKNRGGHTKY